MGRVYSVLFTGTWHGGQHPPFRRRTSSYRVRKLSTLKSLIRTLPPHKTRQHELRLAQDCRSLGTDDLSGPPVLRPSSARRPLRGHETETSGSVSDLISIPLLSLSPPLKRGIAQVPFQHFRAANPSHTGVQTKTSASAERTGAAKCTRVTWTSGSRITLRRARTGSGSRSWVMILRQRRRASVTQASVGKAFCIYYNTSAIMTSPGSGLARVMSKA